MRCGVGVTLAISFVLMLIRVHRREIGRIACSHLLGTIRTSSWCIRRALSLRLGRLDCLLQRRRWLQGPFKCVVAYQVYPRGLVRCVSEV